MECVRVAGEVNDDLTSWERDLAERFRSDLFDLEQSWGEESIIDPTHPLYAVVLAIAFPPTKRRKRKPQSQQAAIQERLEI